MMRALSSEEGCVRLECLRCGAHTPLAQDDYDRAMTGRRNIWCSTCGRLRPLQGRFEREPAEPAESPERPAQAAF